MNHFRILAYHRILPHDIAVTRGTLAVTEGQFELQLKYFLQKGWKAITLKQLYRDYILIGKSPKNVFCITFDDGYRDNYLYAFPILKKLNVPATIFLTAGYINSENDLYFSSSPKLYQPEDIDFLLTERQIKEMQKAGIEFGSHTLSHPYLAELSKELVEKELTKSKQILEQYISEEVISFCYPYGNLENFVIDAVKKAGYCIAVVTPPRSNIPNTVYTLRRTGVYLNDSLLKFKFKCSSLFYYLRETVLWKLLKGIS
ncbi:MAG: polysaccharide deacetylase family protein [Bacteroidetes bacterium]|nr:polysaccharide deacetylase family protein [Bacteroidota bacterium]